MVVESLARQAQALSERSDQPFEEAFEEVLKTPAGYRLADLADGTHRHEKAAKWQAGLLADRHAQRRAHLRISENGYGTREEIKLWRARYMDQVEGTDGRAEYHALLRQRFTRLEG